MTDMSDLAELGALTQSIGEHSVEAIGAENLQGLTAELNVRDYSCTVRVSLKDNSYERQLDVLSKMFDVEELFSDEAIVAVHFVDQIEPAGSSDDSLVPVYSLA
jgi:F0F1-type ATP synthase beta subunit